MSRASSPECMRLAIVLNHKTNKAALQGACVHTCSYLILGEQKLSCAWAGNSPPEFEDFTGFGLKRKQLRSTMRVAEWRTGFDSKLRCRWLDWLAASEISRPCAWLVSRPYRKCRAQWKHIHDSPLRVQRVCFGGQPLAKWDIKPSISSSMACGWQSEWLCMRAYSGFEAPAHVHSKTHKKELMARPCRRWASSTKCNSVSGSNSKLPALLWKRRHADSEIGRGEFPLASKTVLLSRQNEGWLLPKAQRKKLCGDIVWAVAQVHQVAGLETPPPKREEWMCRESQIETFQTVFCPVAEAQG